MTKESLYGIDERLVFRETFNSEFDVRKNCGVPTDVDFSNGIGSFNGTSSKIVYNNVSFSKGITVRFKDVVFDDNSLKTLWSHGDTGDLFVLGAGVQPGIGTNNDINFAMFYSSWKVASSGITPVIGQRYDIVGTMDGTNIKIYVDGELKGTTSGVGIDSRSFPHQIGRRFDASNPNWFDGSLNLSELYNEALTAEEVKNLYEGKTYQELPDKIDENTYKILDVHSERGCLKDNQGNILTPTDVDIKKIDTIYSPDFNGSTSKIDCGNFDNLTGDITYLVWFNARSGGNNDLGYLFSNSKLEIEMYNISISRRLRLSSVGFAPTTVFTTYQGLDFNKDYFIGVIRKSDGKMTIYIGDLDNIPSIDGSVDQDSGTPVSGGNSHIGSRALNDREFDGFIPRTVIYKGLLNTEQITQFYTSTKWKYK